jgi:CheY-like chemotaxis protein
MRAAGEPDAQPTNVRRLQPLRILLCGRDRRFLRVTSFLLSRRGYNVAQSGSADILDAVERHRSDLVIFEPSDSRVATAQTISALQLSKASPALLLVDTSGNGRWNGLPVVDKWTPIDELVREIETAALRRIPPSAAAFLDHRESSSP